RSAAAPRAVPLPPPPPPPPPDCGGACAAPTPVCDVTLARCVACVTDADCGTGKTCNVSARQCTSSCTANTGCTAPTPFCATNAPRICVECLSAADCTDTAKPICSA